MEWSVVISDLRFTINDQIGYIAYGRNLSANKL